MTEYNSLKDTLLDNTRKAGGGLGLYLLLAVNGKAALCCMLGTAFSYLYLFWLCADIDRFKGDDLVPWWEADKVEPAPLRALAKLAAAYYHALQPRLLVPFAMALLATAYNRISDQPLDLFYEACLLGGFLSYKIGLLFKLVGELTPKEYGDGPSRPQVEFVEDELDQWGRPKRPIAVSPIAVLPKDQQEAAEKQLNETLDKIKNVMR